MAVPTPTPTNNGTFMQVLQRASCGRLDQISSLPNGTRVCSCLHRVRVMEFPRYISLPTSKRLPFWMMISVCRYCPSVFLTSAVLNVWTQECILLTKRCLSCTSDRHLDCSLPAAFIVAHPDSSNDSLGVLFSPFAASDARFRILP